MEAENPELRRLSAARHEGQWRFGVAHNTEDRMWFEQGMDQNLAQYHPAIDGPGGYRLYSESGAEATSWTAEAVTHTISRLERTYDFIAVLPSSIEEKSRRLWKGEGYMPQWVLCVYLYTIEEPGIYRELNELLADRRFWVEWFPKYSGDELNFALLHEREQPLLIYARHLIFCMFVLHSKGVIPAHSGSGLFLGSDEPLEHQQEWRSRWTTFRSTTTSQRVASGAGAKAQSLSSIEQYPRIPQIFSISGISEFPEEEEVVILPCVAAGPRDWFANRMNIWLLIRIEARRLFPHESPTALKDGQKHTSRCSIM